MNKLALNNNLIENISALVKNARYRITSLINYTMTTTYFEIGRMIVEDEQKGNNRAEYGDKLILAISERLTIENGKGFSETNIKQMRSFYITYQKQQTLSAKSQKGQTLSDKFKLSWSHYLMLMRISDENERKFYEIEAIENNWSLRELKRQYDSGLYLRLSLSKNKKKILTLATKGLLIEKPEDAIKDPYILEFVGLSEQNDYSENELEQKLIDKIGKFLLELGKGFSFVGRQVRFTFNEEHFRVDLVFYNRLLKCFILIDLKIGKLKHQDIGQMLMYVNYYDRKVKTKDENKTIGIILCQDKEEAVVEYTLPKNNKQIFASKYLTVLPKKEDLKKLIES
ncbi:MAG: PDDEXK nuclease domain-containing protein [Endomicrobia bacterium]|nr:PDDEXK nuclease domain-containing protein [Endomicrobiia bacterium]MCL2507279.1 PDDEXK nuclease domain-containing protein [Endomicrobiia bacterium]